MEVSKRESPLVSIHIITYNQIEFIHETLTSALEQDYENLEVAVADDGSTDGTAEVILEYAAKYPNRLIPLVGGSNIGITGNSNRGLKACNGKYIAFQGGDDVLLPGKITAQVAWMEENEKRVLCGHQVEVFYEDGSRSHVLTPKLMSGVGHTWLIENGVPYGATSIMVRASSVPAYGFDESLHWGSDLRLWIDCVGQSGCWGSVSGIYARYRKHANNISGAQSGAVVGRDIEKMFVDLGKSLGPSFKSSIKKGKCGLVEIPKAKIMLREGRYLTGGVKLLICYVFYPSRLYRAIVFRITKALS